MSPRCLVWAPKATAVGARVDSPVDGGRPARWSASVFESLDYLYMPSRDVAADTRYFHEVLGAEVVFAVDGMGARVAALRLAEGPPMVLLADHLEGERAIL